MNYPIQNNRPPRNAARIVGIVFVVLGVLLGAAALVTNTLVGQSWAGQTEQASGAVVEVRESFRTGSGSPGTRERRYCPIVEYSVDGARHRLESRTCGTSKPTIGEAVTVRYNPADPADASIDSWVGRWLAVVILAGMAALFLVIGIVVFIVAKPKGAATGPGGDESGWQAGYRQ